MKRKASGDGEAQTGGYASPPCLMHELDPAFATIAESEDPQQRIDVQRWRKAERARLIEQRLALAARTRRQHDLRIVAALEAAIAEAEGRVVGAYWPFRGEPNLQPLLERLIARGARGALPVVVGRGRPLEFRAWSPGDTLQPGVWNIPIPSEQAEVLVPDVVIAPVVGFDPACYRLGYGGGFYDRTLAAMEKPPRTLGVGYSLAAIPTLFPQWHDIPMDAVVTEEGVVASRPAAARPPVPRPVAPDGAA